MKLCWNNIENIRLNKFGNFQDTVKKQTYHLKTCKGCGKEFLGLRKSKYCTLRCSAQGSNNNNWKSDVTKKRLPLYNTYAPQLEWAEEVRRKGDILEIRCCHCGKWFVPTRYQVSNRLQFLKGNDDYRGEFRFYCSKKCKDSCDVYGLSEEHYLSRFHREGYKLYKSIVYKLSEENYIKYKSTINPNNLNRGRNKYHLEHKYSIKEGYRRGVIPYIIASPYNLTMLKEFDNISKGDKCSISIEEIIDG